MEHIKEVFNEQSLRDEIVKTWGEAGAHIDVFDMMLNKLKMAHKAPEMYDLLKEVFYHHDTNSYLCNKIVNLLNSTEEV